MAAHTVTVRREQQGIAIHDPLRVAVEVSRIGDVHYLAALGADDTHVGIGIVAIARITHREPLAVGRPRVVDTTVGGVVAAAVGDAAALSRFKVEHHQTTAILDVSEAVAVGRIARAGAVDAVVLEQRLLLDKRGIREIGILVAHDPRLVNIPLAVALRGVRQRTVVGRELGRRLRLRGGGHAPRGGVIDRSHEHLAARDECYLPAVGRDRGRAAAAHGDLQILVGGQVLDNPHVDLSGRARAAQGVYLAVVAEAQRAVGRGREETNGVGLEARHLLRLGRRVGGERPHVERAAALAQEIYRLVAVGIDGIAVLTRAGREIGMLSRREVVTPNIPRNGRGMMFAPDVFAALLVLIEERLAVARETYRFGGGGEHTLGASALDAHGVELAHRAFGEQRAGGGVGDRRAVIDLTAVGRERIGHLGGRMGRESGRRPARSGHREDVEIAEAVAGVRHGFRIGRPYGSIIVTLVGGEASCLAARGGDGIDTALIGESHGATVGRNGRIAHPQR